MCRFCHLHAHTEFSLRDSVARPDKAVQRAKELGYSSYAITDHGTMAGIIPFYKAALKHDVKPILGVEAYYCDDMRTKGDYYHLLLLAKNINGYRSLLRATTEAFTTGLAGQRPQMDWSVIDQLEDVVVTSACVGGIVNGPFLKSDYTEQEKGIRHAKMFQEKFGDDFYMEMQVHERNPEMFQKCNDYSMSVAKKLGIKTLLTNDIHFVNPEDMEIHKVWVALRFGNSIDEVDYVYDRSFYIKTPEEMLAIAKSIGDDNSFDHANEIDDKIDWIDMNISLEHGGVSKMPTYQNMTRDEADNKMIELVIQGLADKNKDTPEYVERAEEELRFMINHNFGSYFLPIWDTLKYAKDNCIPVGPGRGSAGGSLVVNMLGITDIDPMESELKFSRFLNPGRVQKRKSWHATTQDGQEVHLIEGYEYHIYDSVHNKYVIKKAEEIVQEFYGLKEKQSV